MGGFRYQPPSWCRNPRESPTRIEADEYARRDWWWEGAIDTNVLNGRQAALELEAFVRSNFDAGRSLVVLEAGCGRNSELGLDGIPHYLVGVDIDTEALRFRREKWNDLDEEIVADLHTVSLAAETFDIIYSAWVLEHIEGAERILDRFLEWLKPNGVLVIRIPDGDSVFGWVAHRTPHRIHVLYKRWIQRRPNAGKPGFGPYPTVYDDVISLRGIREFAEERGLVVLREDLIAIDSRKLGVFAFPIGLLMRIVSMLTLGRLASDHVNLQFILKK